MSHLNTEERLFTAIDGGTVTDPVQRQKLLANLMAPAQLNLRVDAQVMLIKNFDENLVNGSMGKVFKFTDPTASDMDAEVSDTIGKVKEPPKKTGGMLYPMVRFSVPGGHRDLLVVPETWKVESPSNEILASRTQVSRTTYPHTFELTHCL